MMRPLVSILIITYNHGKFIRQCLEGVMMQKTNFDFEVIIGEDCSKDDTRSIIREFEERYPGIIKPIYHDKNVGGLRNAYEFCYPQIQGKYIACCEGDDFWTDTEKLQKQVDYMEQHPDLSLTFHRINTLYENDGKVVEQPGDGSVKRYSREQIFHIHIPTLSVVFRNCIEFFPEQFYKASFADLFLFGILSKYGGAAELGFVGATYRKHGGGMYSQKKTYEQFKHIIRTRKLMQSSDFFSDWQKEELKREIKRKKIIYMKNFIKKKQLINSVRILLV